MPVIPPLIRPLVDPLGRPLSGGGLPWEGGGGAAPDPYSPAASAIQLPYTAIWISTSGITTTDGGTTASDWLAGWGGIRPTLSAPVARPAYTAGAVPVITPNGTSTFMYDPMTKNSAWNSIEIGFVGSRVSAGAAGDQAIGYGPSTTATNGIVDISAAALRMVCAAAASVNGTSDPDGVTAHWSGDNPGAGAGNNVRKNGTIETAGAGGAFTSRADSGNVFLGSATTAGSAFGNYAVVACYAGPSLTAEQRAYLRALLTFHTGVSS